MNLVKRCCKKIKIDDSKKVKDLVLILHFIKETIIYFVKMVKH